MQKLVLRHQTIVRLSKMLGTNKSFHRMQKLPRGVGRGKEGVREKKGVF